MNTCIQNAMSFVGGSKERKPMKSRAFSPSLLSRIVFATAVMTSTSVLAVPITLPPGPLFFSLTSAGQFSATNSINGSEGLWGIVQISSIDKGTVVPPAGSDIGPSGTPVFTDGQAGGNQITGMYYGIKINPDGVTGTGGFLDLYWQDVGHGNIATELSSAVNLGHRTATDQYLGFTQGSLLVQAAFTIGCDTVATDTVCISSGTTAMSYQNVVGGLWAPRLDSNFFTLDASGVPMISGAKDFRTDSVFTSAANWDIAGTDIIGVSSTDTSGDPIRAVAVPEPGTLVLIGLGLLGLGFSHHHSRIKERL
jgi:hypothetical protein